MHKSIMQRYIMKPKLAETEKDILAVLAKNGLKWSAVQSFQNGFRISNVKMKFNNKILNSVRESGSDVNTALRISKIRISKDVEMVIDKDSVLVQYNNGSLF